MIKTVLPALRYLIVAYPLVACLLLIVTAIPPSFADDFDVDNADSLDFERFHKDKKETVKIWNNKTPSPESQTTPTGQPEASVGQQPSSPLIASATTDGKRYEIRERYSLNRSNSTPYSAFYVIEALHKQMARLCPNGWNKLREWSEPVDSDYYLHYELECR